MPLREIPKTASFSELAIEKFNSLKISIYVIDANWNYLFVNDFVRQNLGERGKDLTGKNLWEQFPELVNDPTFVQLKAQVEMNEDLQLTTTSPLNGQKLSITGYTLRDCYVFSVAILPKKEELINDLRNQLRQKSGTPQH